MNHLNMVHLKVKNTKAKIYSIEVDDRVYNKILRNIKKIEIEKNTYKFNMIGLFTVALHLRIKRKKSFYCAEFVKYVLDKTYLELDLPDIIKPMDFTRMDGLSLIYSGKLLNF